MAQMLGDKRVYASHNISFPTHNLSEPEKILATAERTVCIAQSLGMVDIFFRNHRSFFISILIFAAVLFL